MGTEGGVSVGILLIPLNSRQLWCSMGPAAGVWSVHLQQIVGAFPLRAAQFWKDDSIPTRTHQPSPPNAIRPIPPLQHVNRFNTANMVQMYTIAGQKVGSHWVSWPLPDAARLCGRLEDGLSGTASPALAHT